MTIREAENWIEIEVVDRVPSHLLTPGDVKLAVAVSSNTFSGQGFAWVEAPKLAVFLQKLRELDLRRQGSADLEGMSPGEFRLSIISVDHRGHMAVNGVVSRRGNQGEAGPYRHSVEFGFEFDPTHLPRLLAGFTEIAEGLGQ